MVQNCSIRTCRNRQRNGNNISFFKFPQRPDMRRKWLFAVQRTESDLLKNKDLRVCSHHFSSSDFVFGGNLKKLKNAAVPSLNMKLVKKEKIENHHEESSEMDENELKTAAVPSLSMELVKKEKIENHHEESSEMDENELKTAAVPSLNMELIKKENDNEINVASEIVPKHEEAGEMDENELKTAAVPSLNMELIKKENDNEINVASKIEPKHKKAGEMDENEMLKLKIRLLKETTALKEELKKNSSELESHMRTLHQEKSDFREEMKKISPPMSHMESEIRLLLLENVVLNEQCQKHRAFMRRINNPHIFYSKLQHNNRKIFYYTGFEMYSIMEAVLCPAGRNEALNIYNERPTIIPIEYHHKTSLGSAIKIAK